MNPYPRRVSASLLAAAIGCLLAGPGWAGGANFIVVTTTSDSMDAFDQACSLREALANANTNTQYSPVVDECQGGSGSTTDEIVLQGGATYALTLAGNDDDTGDLDVHNDPALAAELVDLRITRTGDGNATILQQVAGQRVLHNDGADLYIASANIQGGSTADVGGGIYNQAGGLTLYALMLSNNTAVSGGGLYTETGADINDLWVTQNSADLIGGAIYSGDGILHLVDTGIDDNSAANGAGIYASNGSVSLENANVTSNTATGDGGGIYGTGATDLRLTDAEVTGNASQGSGGGIYSDSSVDVRLTRSEFSDNTAAVNGGGARVLGSEVHVVGGMFSANEAEALGGGIYAGRANADGTAFVGNTAGDSGGGVYSALACNFEDALFSSNSAQLNGGGAACELATSLRTRFEQNLAYERGGAIHADNYVTIEESAFVSNTALIDGGGVWIKPANFNSRVTRTLFEENVALGNGGGFWIGADDLHVAFANSTFSGNVASVGDGSALYIGTGANAFAYNTTFAANGPAETIAKYGELTLQNSIISSAGLNCVSALDDPEIISLGYNIASDDSCVGLDVVGDQAATDPLLAPLANNGGNTRTHALLDGSPAIDAALDVGCQGSLTIGVDQRGAARPELGCDIGAHEQEVELAEIFADGFED